MEKEIILSDGQSCTVRVLGLFELDDVAPENAPGPFYERVTGVDGRTVSTLYQPPTVPPDKPEQPRAVAEENSQLYEAWMEYDTYQEYLAHRRSEAAFINTYAQNAKTALLHECVSKEDLSRIIDDVDWRKVHGAALSSQLTEEDIAVVLRNNFQSEIPWPPNFGGDAG